ncbi:hypothetical protein Taro_037464 [Colocasia esculenta]|uniref:Uncharacterized protein n=1 Tax=Colocasia esculenta TaxID=4460 RepID=A0A843WGB9_COLES|nr:hypothetical protein [Colocasia esculenta]
MPHSKHTGKRKEKKQGNKERTGIAAMAKASPFPPMHTALSPAKLPECNAIRSLPVQRSPHFTPHRNRHSTRRRVSAQAAAPAFSLPINVDYLEREFGGHGASFRGVGDSCVVKMALGGGSTASLMLPSGLVTSYKPQMWHGTTVEVLQTSVSGGEGGEVVIQGGVSLGFKCRSTEEGEGEEEHSWWSASSWALRDVRESPEASIQGRRNSVVVERRGFDEFYVFSPGSGHEWYGKYAYVCTGPSAILAPIVLGPGGVWRGGQYLHNPNIYNSKQDPVNR